MGVGAAIAIGSQGEKGYRALFVMKVKTINLDRYKVLILELNTVKSG
jgi:hypothetical protein